MIRKKVMNQRYSEKDNMLIHKALHVLGSSHEYAKASWKDVVEKASEAFKWDLKETEERWIRIAEMADKELKACN
jgi:hypothetical protein